MAASTSQGVADTRNIECPVCFEIYHMPKCLSCGHSVCGGCCQQLIRQEFSQPGILSNLIECPVCRQDTKVPDGGLAINYGMQVLIQDMISNRIQINEMKLSELKRQLADEQLKWTRNVQKGASTMKMRVDDIVQASQELQKMTLEDVDKVNKEFQGLSTQTYSLNVPQSLVGLDAFEQSFQDVSSKLEKLTETRRRTIIRANSALKSAMARGLDCFLNGAKNYYGGEQVGDEVGSSHNVGVVSPPLERPRICYHCKEEGHIWDDCPRQGLGGSGSAGWNQNNAGNRGLGGGRAPGDSQNPLGAGRGRGRRPL